MARKMAQSRAPPGLTPAWGPWVGHAHDVNDNGRSQADPPIGNNSADGRCPIDGAILPLEAHGDHLWRTRSASVRHPDQPKFVGAGTHPRLLLDPSGQVEEGQSLPTILSCPW